jgi:hypothetical protein
MWREKSQLCRGPRDAGRMRGCGMLRGFALDDSHTQTAAGDAEEVLRPGMTHEST